MQKNNLLLRVIVLVTAMMCALGIQALEAYTCYENSTLTFYYDNQRSSRLGTTYSLNTGNIPAWYVNSRHITKVVFDSSFANARPTSTYCWFFYMSELETIEGISNLNTSSVTNMSGMFNYCSELTNLNLSSFNTTNVTNMNSMFAFCFSLTSLDLSNFNTAKVTDMKHMFNGCSELTSLNLSNFNTSKVTDMERMFYQCPRLSSLDLRSFNTSKVINMAYMFDGCSDLTTINVSSGWTTAAVTSSDYMFDGCTSLVGGWGTAYNDSNPKDKTYAHIDGGPSNPGYLTDPDAPVPYACYMYSTLTFYYDNQRSSRPGKTYDLNTGSDYAPWDIDGVNVYANHVVFDPSFADYRPTTTCDWFYNMQNLLSIEGIEYLNTSEVTNMAWMFEGCKKLTSLDLSGFKTNKVTNMLAMFRFCTKLETIYVGNDWSTAAVTESTNMFWDCTKLVGGQGTTYNASHDDKAYAHIDGGPSNPGYFTTKNAFLRGDVNGDNNVSISDVTALIKALLNGDTTVLNSPAADCDQNGNVSISDVTRLVNYLLNGSW